MQVSIHEAKTHLSRLLEQVAAGEEIIIAKRNKPIARLMPLSKREAKSRIGGLKERPFKMNQAFDEASQNQKLADEFSVPL